MAKLVIGTNKQTAVPAVVKEVQVVNKYAYGNLIKDDSNNDVGYVCGYIKSGNVTYAVIATNETTPGKFLSTAAAGGYTYNNLTMWTSSVTATTANNAILNNSGGYSSSAVSNCRSYSYVIDGVTYYGQLPTPAELAMALVFKKPGNITYWTCFAYSAQNAWFFANGGGCGSTSKTTYYSCLPILEIPITE